MKLGHVEFQDRHVGQMTNPEGFGQQRGEVTSPDGWFENTPQE